MFRMITLLPCSLMHRQCECYEPTKTGRMPPCQYIPLDSSTPMEDGEKRRPIKVQVLITNSVQKDYYECEGGDTEALICLICAHETLIKDLKLKDNIANHSSLMAAKIAAKNGNPIQSEKRIEQRPDQRAQGIYCCHSQGRLQIL